jgi:hypothetical protein
LRAGFDRLIRFSLSLTFIPLSARAGCARIITHQLSEHWERGPTIAAVYPERRQP